MNIKKSQRNEKKILTELAKNLASEQKTQLGKTWDRLEILKEKKHPPQPCPELVNIFNEGIQEISDDDLEMMTAAGINYRLPENPTQD